MKATTPILLVFALMAAGCGATRTVVTVDEFVTWHQDLPSWSDDVRLPSGEVAKRRQIWVRLLVRAGRKWVGPFRLRTHLRRLDSTEITIGRGPFPRTYSLAEVRSVELCVGPACDETAAGGGWTILAVLLFPIQLVTSCGMPH